MEPLTLLSIAGLLLVATCAAIRWTWCEVRYRVYVAFGPLTPGKIALILFIGLCVFGLFCSLGRWIPTQGNLP